ncbi:hypothetical protein [Paractinoplanes toevensis]|uniref:Uncharacterized protein n=1 Tax=Paractinoplanes toevensis TaxID=571911 RepID=A0A919T403_9ACTN|nr:hypothetical protein [Actinoplanes toevensis]GIM88808.1 hypothetical protein Ato02nite_006010 [Actinoplanes toevensis]
MLNDPPPAPPKPARHWTGAGRRRSCRVETVCDGELVIRGWIRPVDLADTTGPGLAGHTVWDLKTYDHVQLEPVTGDYLTAEKAVLDATKELEN